MTPQDQLKSVENHNGFYPEHLYLTWIKRRCSYHTHRISGARNEIRLEKSKTQRPLGAKTRMFWYKKLGKKPRNWGYSRGRRSK